VTTGAGSPESVSFRGAGVRLAGDRWPGAADGARPHGVVLLLHGGGQTRHSWSGTARSIAAQGWTAVSVDARGHGDSDWAPDGDYSIDALIADLAAVVAAVAPAGGERPVLVGASMGGMTALVGQGERGDLARALVLVLVDIVPTAEPEGVRRIMDFMTARPDGFGSLEEVAEAVRAYNPHRSRPVRAEGLRKNVRLGPGGRWHWHWDPAFVAIGDEPTRAASEERARQAAAQVRVPTLLVRGDQSDVVGDAGVSELLALIPGAEYVNVPATGHMVAGDDNDVFTRRVNGFLAGLAGSSHLAGP
jgi:pimeloyl-ACP methyl ester carboxylesterase